MADIDDVLKSLGETIEAQRQYDNERREAQEAGDVSWDWSGRCYDELLAAQTDFKNALETYLREAVEQILAGRGDGHSR